MINYVMYEDGTVVAYRPERDERNWEAFGVDWRYSAAPRGGRVQCLWIASAWSAHPLRDEGARHLGHLCHDAPWSELAEALRAWSAEHGGVVASEWLTPDDASTTRLDGS